MVAINYDCLASIVEKAVKGATPGPRKQTSAGQGLINISVTTETGESWEGQCAGVSRSAM